MQTYLDLMRTVLEEGSDRLDRTGVGTRALFGRQLCFDLATGFPLVTTKRLHLKSIIHELLWFLRGDTNTKYLHEHGVTIWDEWTDENGELSPTYGKQRRNTSLTGLLYPGELGPIYGKQWRRWQGPNGKVFDQISAMIELIKTQPHSRRIMLSAWNVSDLNEMKLLPCHVLAQVWIDNDRLSLQLYQRSADLFLGVPFNIASYALFVHMLAQVTNYRPGHFIHTFGDVHIYNSHIEQVQEQLTRTPRSLPTLRLNPEVQDIFAFKYKDFVFEGYDPHPRITAKVAV